MDNKSTRYKYIMTHEEAVKKHRELWLGVAELIKKTGKVPNDLVDPYAGTDLIKGAVLDEQGYDTGYVDCFCWCCEYEDQIGSVSDCSKHCPIMWDGGDGTALSTGCCTPGSSYKRFIYAETVDEAVEAAIAVANLPAREYKKELNKNL